MGRFSPRQIWVFGVSKPLPPRPPQYYNIPPRRFCCPDAFAPRLQRRSHPVILFSRKATFSEQRTARQLAKPFGDDLCQRLKSTLTVINSGFSSPARKERQPVPRVPGNEDNTASDLICPEKLHFSLFTKAVADSSSPPSPTFLRQKEYPHSIQRLCG